MITQTTINWILPFFPTWSKINEIAFKENISAYKFSGDKASDYKVLNLIIA